MKKILTFVFGSFLLVGLNGCVMSQQEATAYYGSFSNQELCMSYLTADPINIYQSDRKSEINKRRLNCTPYVEMARLKYNQERAVWNSLYGAVDSLNKSGTTTTNTNSLGTSASGFLSHEKVSGWNKICYYDTVYGTKTLNIDHMAFCPSQY